MLHKRRAFKSARIAVTFSSVLMLGFSQASTAAETCDQACLGGLLNQYVDAVVAHDHSKLPWPTRCVSRRTPRTSNSAKGSGNR